MAAQTAEIESPARMSDAEHPIEASNEDEKKLRNLTASAKQMFAFFKRRRRSGWRRGDLARELGYSDRTVKRSYASLCKAGLFDPQRHGDYNSSKVARKSLNARPVRRSVPEHLKPVLGYLRRNCARKEGIYSCTQTDIAKALRMPILTVVEHVGELRTKEFIGIVRHCYHNSYFIVGREPVNMDLTAIPEKPGWYVVKSNEPTTLSIQGAILRVVRRSAARSGDSLCSLTRPQIAKRIRHSLVSVNHGMAELKRKNLFPVINRGRGGRWISFSVAPPAAPSKRSLFPAAPAAKRGPGRSPGSFSRLNLRIIERWREIGSPKFTPQILDTLASEFYHSQFSKAKPGSKRHTILRKRVRGVLSRYRTSLAKTPISVSPRKSIA